MPGTPLNQAPPSHVTPHLGFPTPPTPLHLPPTPPQHQQLQGGGEGYPHLSSAVAPPPPPQLTSSPIAAEQQQHRQQLQQQHDQLHQQQQQLQQLQIQSQQRQQEHQQSLLRTPTRNPNRSAGDVLMDIGTMLADLTDELDTMLQLDKK